MPALGQTVEVASIMPSMDSMSPGEFMRAFGNVVTSSDSDLFPPEWWPRSLNAFQARPDKGLVFGFDVSFDPAARVPLLRPGLPSMAGTLNWWNIQPEATACGWRSA